MDFSLKPLVYPGENIVENAADGDLPTLAPERRSFRRHLFHAPITCQNSHYSFLARLHDLSVAGLGIRSNLFARKGSVLHLRLTLPAPTQTLVCQAVVVRQPDEELFFPADKRLAAKPGIWGLELVYWGETSRRRIQEFIRRQESGNY